jgi:metallo-beta-lactamase family protein
MNYPDILHHGAKDGVTGSCHQLLMDAEHSMLIDFARRQIRRRPPGH